MAPFGSHQQATVQTGDGDAFSQLLLSLRQTSQSLQPLSEQQNEQNVAQQVDWEQLQQWFQLLPTHDGYADKHILSTEMIQSFLSLLPEETKEQIVQRFSAEPPFETMFSASDDHDEKDELMLVIALFQLEQKQRTIPEPIIEQARATLRHLFGAHDERSGTITAMIQTMIDSQKRWETNENIQHDETWKSLFSDSVQKQVVQLPQERKQWTSQLSHLVHAVQQSNDKHVPFDRPTIDTTNETPFVAQFERIVRSSQFTRWKNGNAQMLIRLHPEHLGYITIKLIQQKGKLTAKMITSTEAAKQLVEQHIHQLSHIADRVTVEQFDVFNEAKFRDHAFHQQKQQQQQQQQKEEKKQPDQSFDEWLKELFHFDV
ncbi:flagellar hook-length control protein FliK [Anoxybacillus pushchinoensis]|nr:flagellar hook-length control protein FliK [Anoxybacillus pushchinoensis]